MEEDKTLTELPQATLPLAPATLIYLVQDADTIPRSVQAPAGALAALLSNPFASTDELAEGAANLYFTNGRADARADIRIGTALALLPPDYGDADADARVAAGLALHLPADEHPQYHNDARALTWLGGRTTDDLAEGAKLYYTNSRADARIALAIALLPPSYDDAQAAAVVAAGLALHIPADDHTQYHTDARALTWLGGRTTDDLAEGVAKLYYTDVRADARIALALPNLGTPTTLTLTNATGLPIASGVSGLASGVATLLATPSSANLLAALTDKTGTGLNVFGTAPTLVAPVTLTGVVGSSALTINGATQTASFPVLDASQTWNAAGTTFTALKLNVTATASAAASKLLDLQVGGGSKLSVTKFGDAVFGDAARPGFLSFGGTTSAFGAISVLTAATAKVAALTATGAAYTDFGASILCASTGVKISTSGYMAWTDNGGHSLNAGTPQTFLYNGGANIVEQRNLTNAQTLRVYGTYTDASNYERIELGFKAVTNVATIRSTANGTGTVRDLALDPGTADLQIVKALVALGGGAAPTVGTIGGAGPAAAAQNSWLRLKDSTGAAFWVPAWK